MDDRNAKINSGALAILEHVASNSSDPALLGWLINEHLFADAAVKRLEYLISVGVNIIEGKDIEPDENANPAADEIPKAIIDIARFAVSKMNGPEDELQRQGMTTRWAADRFTPYKGAPGGND